MLRPPLLMLLLCARFAAPASAEDQAAAPAVRSTAETADTGWRAAARGYAAAKGAAVVEKGAGPVRFLLVGGADPASR